MFCNKCGSELPRDSQFCIKCGNKLEQLISIKGEKETNSKIKRRISKISSNPVLNIFFIITFIVILIIAYKLITSNLSEINFNRELAEITENIIELKEKSTFLGSSYLEKQELKEYNSQINKSYFIIMISSLMIILSLIGGTYLASKLIRLRKKQGV